MLVTRNSVAYKKDYSVSAANVARTETSCVATRPTINKDSASVKIAFDIDSDAGVIICSGGTLSTVLYTTTPASFGDGSSPSYTTVVDISSDADFSAIYASGVYVKSLKVMGNGQWVMCVSATATGSQGYLFRSTDKGVTWVRCKFADDSDFRFSTAYVDRFGWCAVQGAECAIGEYGATANGEGRRVYYSADYGTTWAMIYEPDVVVGRHLHTCCFSPTNTNTIYISYGDGATARKVSKITFTGEDKTNPASWTETPYLFSAQPTAMVAWNGYLYMGRDGDSRSNLVERLNPTDDAVEVCYGYPIRNETTTEVSGVAKKDASPYLMEAANQGNVFQLLVSDGVMYAANSGEGLASGSTTERVYGGIYVSVDGMNWACAIRTPSSSQIEGFGGLIGKLGGYLWGIYNDGTNARLCRVSVPVVQNIVTTKVEAGQTNILTAAQSDTFTGPYSGSNYRLDATSINLAAPEQVTESGETFLRLTGAYNAGVTSGRLRTVVTAVIAGDLLCARVRIRGLALPPGFLMSIAWSDAKIVEQANNLTPTSKWTDIVAWGRCITSGNVDLKVTVSGTATEADWANVQFDIDKVSITKFGNVIGGTGLQAWLSSSWQIGGTARANEYGTVFQNTKNKSTTFFEWKPSCGSREWLTDLPIATLSAGSKYLYLFWDQSAKEFCLTDGTDSISTDTTNAITWEHTDWFRFAIVRDGDKITFYVHSNSRGGETPVVGDTLGAGLNATSVLLSTNADQTAFGCGLFSEFKTVPIASNATDVSNLFSKLRNTYQLPRYRRETASIDRRAGITGAYTITAY